jgi:hypothetical protein
VGVVDGTVGIVPGSGPGVGSTVVVVSGTVVVVSGGIVVDVVVVVLGAVVVVVVVVDFGLGESFKGLVEPGFGFQPGGGLVCDGTGPAVGTTARFAGLCVVGGVRNGTGVLAE